MRLGKIAMTAAFATATTGAMLAGAALQPTSGPATFASIASVAAFADDEGNHGGQDCVNPAGHERGWCKDANNDQGENGERKHRKHHRRNGSSNTATISGTVLGINGNIAQFRLDNGSTIAVNDGNTPLNVGQHYTLSGCYQNNVFLVNCNGNGQNQGGYNNQQQVSGTILSVSGNIVTLLGLPPVRIDISQAQSNGAISGTLTPARSITAYGYYQNGTFFATSIR